MRWSKRHPLEAMLIGLLIGVISVSGDAVVVHHRRATQQRRVADEQLRGAIHLTGMLQGDLYTASTSLSGSESAHRQLRDRALQTLDSLYVLATQEPLRIELAAQYGKLAKLEMAEANNAEGRKRTAAEIYKALRILGNGQAPETARMRRTLERFQRELR